MKDTDLLKNKIRELEKQLDFHRLITENTTDMISKHDAEGIFLFASEACRALLGYAPEELVGRSAYEFHHPDDIANTQASHREIMDTPIIYTVPYRFRHKQGHYLWVETTSKVVRNPANNDIEFIITASRDITPRKRIEEALDKRLAFERIIGRIAIKLLALHSDHLDVGFDQALATIGASSGVDRAYLFLFRKDSRLADNTNEWCAQGIAPQKGGLQGVDIQKELPWFYQKVRQREIFSISDISMLPPEAHSEQNHFQRQAIQSLIVVPMIGGRQLLGFFGFDMVQNQRIWADDDKAILQLFAEIFSNAIQRRRIENELRRSEDRWQFALEGTGDGVWDWNTVTNAVYFSRQWKAMLGYTAVEIDNTLEEWKTRVHPEDMQQVMADLNRHIEGNTELYQNEHRILCKDGSYIWVLDRGKVIDWTQDGKPLRVIGTQTDISERKQAEAERERLIADLKGALKEVKTLSGLLPICSSCKKVRDDQGYWNQIESYINKHTEAKFSHSLCPECSEKLYGGQAWYEKIKKKSS